MTFKTEFRKQLEARADRQIKITVICLLVVAFLIVCRVDYLLK